MNDYYMEIQQIEYMLPSEMYNKKIRLSKYNKFSFSITNGLHTTHQSRLITVTLEEKPLSDNLEWEIIYYPNGISDSPDRQVTIEYGVGQFGEVLETIHIMCGDYLSNYSGIEYSKLRHARKRDYADDGSHNTSSVHIQQLFVDVNEVETRIRDLIEDISVDIDIRDKQSPPRSLKTKLSLEMSRDLSDTHSGKWLTVTLEEKPLSDNLEWKIYYDNKDIFGSGKSRILQYSQSDELINTIERWCYKYFDSTTLHKNTIEHNIQHKLSEVTTRTYFKNITTNFLYTLNRELYLYFLEPKESLQRDITIYSITDASDDKCFIQFRSPCEGEYLSYTTIQSTDVSEIKSKLQEDVYGVVCNEENKNRILTSIFEEYTILNDEEINTQLSLCSKL